VLPLDTQENKMNNNYDTAKEEWKSSHKTLQGFDTAFRAAHNLQKHGKTKELSPEDNVTIAGPKITSYGLVKVLGGWSVATISTIDGIVVSTDFSEPEYKNFALERLMYKMEVELIAKEDE